MTDKLEQELIGDLEAKVEKLEAELAKVYEIARSEAALAREKAIQLFHKLGFNHADAKAKTNEVLGPE